MGGQAAESMRSVGRIGAVGTAAALTAAGAPIAAGAAGLVKAASDWAQRAPYQPPQAGQ
jgi:hypothetical protein